MKIKENGGYTYADACRKNLPPPPPTEMSIQTISIFLNLAKKRLQAVIEEKTDGANKKSLEKLLDSVGTLIEVISKIAKKEPERLINFNDENPLSQRLKLFGQQYKASNIEYMSTPHTARDVKSPGTKRR